jgi:translation initiation factor IF-2
LKIRIFALAKELGIDSKVLIGHCQAAGLTVKNALATISPEERDKLVAYLDEGKRAVPVATATETEVGELAPVRNTVPDLKSRVRNIKTMSPRPQGAKPTATTVTQAEAEPETPTAEPALPETEVVSEVAADATPVAQDEEAASEPKAKPSKADAVKPISREDYVSAAGSRMRSMREMKPRGTQDREVAAREAVEEQKQTLPNVAAVPDFKPPPVKRKPEEKVVAQKPDVKLTPGILESASPLGGRMKHKTEQNTRRTGKGRAPTDLRKARERAETEAQDQLRKQRRHRGGRQSGGFRRRQRSKRPRGPIEFKTSAQIEFPITLRGFSEALGRPASVFLNSLFQQGQMITINDAIDEETAFELAMEVGVDLEVKRGRDLEQELAAMLEDEGGEETRQERPPMVTILGHVDHGKTTLLDRLRSANVAEGEAGGITQHIASYQVDHNGKKLTFVDTPGHAAFGEMRARGASVTDIVVLVVAADDGVMPQTVECISHAKAAGVPIVVAMNKVDLPDTDEQRLLQGLATQDVLPAEWGGDVEVVRTSAMTGQGLDDLLDTLLITAELQEFTADPTSPAVGVCLEGFRDEGRGSIAWFVVGKGTLRVGDVVLCGQAYGRIRAMFNDRDESIDEAPPSTPVKVTGLDIIPSSGSHFFVMPDIEQAREVAENRRDLGRTEILAGGGRPRTLEDILEAARGGAVQDLPLIIKADTPGSLEALKSELDKTQHPEVRVKVVHEGIGGVNESDVSLASASGAIIIAFHVVAEERARVLADEEGIEVRRYNIIYEVTDDIRLSLEGMLLPERVEVATGRTLVLRTFSVSRFGTIAGCRVLSGTIERSHRVHVIRDQKVLNHYAIASLRREKDDVREVREGMECGIRLEGFNDIKEGDLLEAYRVDEVKRKLD